MITYHRKCKEILNITKTSNVHFSGYASTHKKKKLL